MSYPSSSRWQRNDAACGTWPASRSRPRERRPAWHAAPRSHARDAGAPPHARRPDTAATRGRPTAARIPWPTKAPCGPEPSATRHAPPRRRGHERAVHARAPDAAPVPTERWRAASSRGPFPLCPGAPESPRARSRGPSPVTSGTPASAIPPRTTAARSIAWCRAVARAPPALPHDSIPPEAAGEGLGDVDRNTRRRSPTGQASTSRYNSTSALNACICVGRAARRSSARYVR